MTEKINSLIKEAFLSYEYRYAEAMDKIPAAEIQTSEAFNEKMRALIRDPRIASSGRGLGRKTIALLIAAAVLISLLTACACIPKIRGFFVEFYEDHIRISKHDENPSQSDIETYYMPSLIPDGYEETHYVVDYNSNMHTWQNGDAGIAFSQDIPTNDVFTMDTEECETHTFVIDGIEYFCTIREGLYKAIRWSDGTYLYLLSCPYDISLDFMKEMIKSMEEIDPDTYIANNS